MPSRSNTQQGTEFVLETVTQQFVDELNAEHAPPLSKITLEEARAAHARGQDVPVVKLPADVEDRTIAVAPNNRLLMRIVRPKARAGVLPAVMYLHGGGFVLIKTVKVLAQFARAGIDIDALAVQLLEERGEVVG